MNHVDNTPGNSESEVRSLLREIGSRHQDGLKTASRRAIVAAGLEATAPSRRARAAIQRFIPSALAAAALLVVLMLPALAVKGGRPAWEPNRNPIKDLQVNTVNGRVVLSWSDGQGPHRVVKATSREQLSHASDLPGEIVTGETWVDRGSDSSNIVYYLVD